MPQAYALVHQEDGYFGISFPDYPGCISGGETAEEAIRSGSEILTFHVRGMVEDGLPLPDLRTLPQLQADPVFRGDAKGAVVALVPFSLPTKTVRVNFTIDENLLKAIDRAAERAGQSRSAFLAEAARQRVAV